MKSETCSLVRTGKGRFVGSGRGHGTERPDELKSRADEMRSICAVTTTPRPGHAGSIDLCHMSHEARTWCGRAGEEGGPCALAQHVPVRAVVAW
jgi:hypothetical protein